MTEDISKIRLWLMAARPKTLPAAAAPVAVGTAVAVVTESFILPPALAAFLGALLLQIAVNLANDYFDAQNSIDSEERLGPVRVTQSGLIPPGQVRAAMIICLLAAAVVFGFLTLYGGQLLFWVGVVSVLAALAYSGGPYPLASHGLGELFVFIFFGLVAVCGTYYVQAKTLNWLVVVASFPPGLLITAIMVVNNLRDIETDAKAGKRTLAVRLGRTRTIWFYRLLLAAAYVVPASMFIWKMEEIFVLLPLATGAMAITLAAEIGNVSGSQLNTTLAKSARLSLFFSLLFAVGIIL